jgi:hypothetical protein
MFKSMLSNMRSHTLQRNGGAEREKGGRKRRMRHRDERGEPMFISMLSNILSQTLQQNGGEREKGGSRGRRRERQLKGESHC